jgi:hypothetical protein
VGRENITRRTGGTGASPLQHATGSSGTCPKSERAGVIRGPATRAARHAVRVAQLDVVRGPATRGPVVTVIRAALRRATVEAAGPMATAVPRSRGPAAAWPAGAAQRHAPRVAAVCTASHVLSGVTRSMTAAAGAGGRYAMCRI